MNFTSVQNKTLRHVEIHDQPTTIVTSQRAKSVLRLRLSTKLIFIAFKSFGLSHPRKVIKAIGLMKRKYYAVYGEPLLNKISKVDGKYYWKLATPGFPSEASDLFLENSINRAVPFKSKKGLAILLLGITKKCPLSCEHCYEWDRMHQKEKLSRDDLLAIIHKYQDFGTTQFQLGGGEPLLRIKDIYYLLEKAKKGSDFWVVTSGWKFGLEQADKLKKSGLTGLMVSVDHHLPEEHDKFRGKTGSFDMAIEAVQHAKSAKLVTGLSVCPTIAYTTESNFRAYMELAKKLGVTFVQVFEPKPAGRYSGQKVLLSKSQTDLLEEMYLSYNQDPMYADYPIINYVGYHQRRVGCFGSGDYYLYVDTDGDAHKCPVCSNKVCNALAFPVEDTVNLLQQTSGCNYFDQNEV